MSNSEKKRYYGAWWVLPYTPIKPSKAPVAPDRGRSVTAIRKASCAKALNSRV